MRFGLLTAFLSAAALAGCATSQGAMGHSAMNHEEMMRHCQMMEQHHGVGNHDSAGQDPAQHNGMSHEEMMRHCAEMRQHGNGECDSGAAGSSSLDADGAAAPFWLRRRRQVVEDWVF